MSEFTNTFKSTTARVYDSRAALNLFSENPKTLQGLNPEVAAVAFLLQSAIDNNKPKAYQLSTPDCLSDGTASFKVAAIGLERNDIAGPTEPERRHQECCLETIEQYDLCFTRLNPQRNPPFCKEDWVEHRMKLLKECLDLGVNIISLGEFDYPPELGGDDGAEFNDKFQKQVQDTIDSYPHPVFLVMGTRHDYDDESRTCANRARIFANKILDDLPKPGLTDDRPILHEKQISATKAGERISPAKVSNLQYYSTKYGNIGVLICVDAYNPTVLFSLLNSKLASDLQSLDIILVPAYNQSDKLYYACQILSLLCGCYVVLIDACSESNRPEKLEKPERTQLFVAGRSFNHLHQQDISVGDPIQTENDLIKAWDLSVDFLKLLRNSDQSDVTQMFNTVKRYVNQTSI